MPTGISALSKTLIGVEALAGATTDTPTTTWRGMGTIKDRQEIVFPPEKVGIFGGTTRSYIPRTGGECMLEADATYEQLAYIHNAGIYLTTATTDTGSGYIRTWTTQLTASSAFATTDLGTLVIETGDNIDVETMRYGFVREYTLTGGQGAGMSVSALVQGRAPSTATAFTSVGTTDLDNAAETILFSKVTLSIDPSTDTIGTTAKSETILDMSYKMTTGWVELPAKDGRTDFSSIKRVSDEAMLDITFEHNSVAIAEKAAWRAQTERALQLKFTGTALTAAGAYTLKTFIMNLYGKWMTFGAEGLEEADGDNNYKGTFKVAYSSAAVAKSSFILVTDQVTLP